MSDHGKVSLEIRKLEWSNEWQLWLHCNKDSFEIGRPCATLTEAQDLRTALKKALFELRIGLGRPAASAGTVGGVVGGSVGSAAPDGSLTGWWNPEPMRSTSKFHYIGLDGRALCGRWAYLRGDIEEGKDDHPDNCAACRRKKLAMNAKAANTVISGEGK